MLRAPSLLQSRQFDVLVIGGGIYGAWVAYDAALRGLSVAIVEKDDWASGTSSASSKLIHGGLRYLEYGHVGLVAKTLQERSRLLRLAPHRVWPLRFLLPLTAEGRAGRFALTMALSVYDHMAGRRSGVPKHRYLEPRDLCAQMPWAMAPDVSGGFLYSDAGTDDARLTLELIDGALTAGAVAINHATCTELMREGSGAIAGGLVTDTSVGKSYEVGARLTVITAGPWCSQVLGSDPGPIRYSKGVHVVMPPLPGTVPRAILLTAPQDRRVFFLIPWYGATLLGTTDSDFHFSSEKLQVESSDIDYLLQAVQQRCPQLGWTRADIRGSFAGIRTLVGAPAGAIGAVSREWSLVEPQARVLVSVGGKLTSARIEAAATVDRCLQLLGQAQRPTITGQRRLPWAPVGSWPTWKKNTMQRGCTLGLDQFTAHTAARRYGTRIERLFSVLAGKPALAHRIDARYPFCAAEIPIATDFEMALTRDDIFRRRIPLSILGSQCPGLIADIAIHK